MAKPIISDLEYWGNDERADVLFFNTPVRHHSVTPLLQGRDFQELLQPFNLAIAYNSVSLCFFLWQGTGGVEFGCESFGLGCNRLIDGFGNGFEHAVEYPLMKRIQYIPVKYSK